ncbi:hypothetical protein J6590_052265 [Homalodisca vitripennis]|nr:hypothetical protein J6590_052265 [Homalodisca vitripennis]
MTKCKYSKSGTVTGNFGDVVNLWGRKFLLTLNEDASYKPLSRICEQKLFPEFGKQEAGIFVTGDDISQCGGGLLTRGHASHCDKSLTLRSCALCCSRGQHRLQVSCVRENSTPTRTFTLQAIPPASRRYYRTLQYQLTRDVPKIT